MDLHSIGVGVRIYQKFQLPHNLPAPLRQCHAIKVQIFFEKGTDALPQTGFDPGTQDGVPTPLPRLRRDAIAD
jgi:hypothetical protein